MSLFLKTALAATLALGTVSFASAQNYTPSLGLPNGAYLPPIDNDSYAPYAGYGVYGNDYGAPYQGRSAYRRDQRSVAPYGGDLQGDE